MNEAVAQSLVIPLEDDQAPLPLGVLATMVGVHVRVSPDWAVIPAGNAHGHPHAPTVTRLKQVRQPHPAHRCGAGRDRSHR